MTIYWERCDLCGQYRPVKKCTLMPDISIDIHCCIACPYWMNKCGNPAWKIELPTKTSMRLSGRTISIEEKTRLLEELTSILKNNNHEQ